MIQFKIPIVKGENPKNFQHFKHYEDLGNFHPMSQANCLYVQFLHSLHLMNIALD
jgi:hypothetical protein